jgi:3-oxoacyl-[acyl-carrier protein] reductase
MVREPQNNQDTVVVVTGAASGIGSATATRFAMEGSKVVVADIDSEAAESKSRELSSQGGTAAFIYVDVVDAQSVARLFDDARAQFGQINVIVNNAGVGMRRSPMLEVPEEEWDRQLALNLKSVYLGCKYGAPHLVTSGGGAIVNVASLSGVFARPGFSAYAAAKAGVVMLTRVLAKELAPTVRVNSVSPVSTDTGMLPQLAPIGQSLEEFKEGMRAGIPLGRLNQPRDVAAAILFLASADAQMITGHNLVVDGGTS